MPDKSNVSEDKVVWGAEAIGRVIGRDARQTHHLLAIGAIPAKKIGGRWAADAEVLRNLFRETDAA
jgi:hypothetical protein